MPEKQQPEPWLRGSLQEIPAVQRAVLHALELAAEDLDHWCASLTEAEIHARPSGLPSVVFHLRHIARSIDRLLTYAEGRQLNQSQLAALNSESEPAGTPQSMHEELHSALQNAATRILSFASTSLELPRSVGRQNLPSTVGGLLVHIADHTQRHTGQAVTTAKLLHAQRDSRK